MSELPTSTPQTTKSCPAATKPVQRAKRKLSTLKAQVKRIRCMQSQQRSYENERKEKQYRRRSRQTKKLQDEREGDQTCRYRFHLKSAQHTARLPTSSPELLARVVIHRHTENDKLISNPDKNGSCSIRNHELPIARTHPRI
jgi:hypothetical protein